ncbi:calcium-binding protein [Shimia sp. MMG029]|uniref:calcium-binding protein n=1 Tax=Shimia sp. MMG029 TaxID=3021978 RepID=UPI0022FDF50A|nr:hypothetical protein [Shimia sp. MMG029]MDA5555349.1 hypothetical protein [Shimia sp. MMG029]
MELILLGLLGLGIAAPLMGVLDSGSDTEQDSENDSDSDSDTDAEQDSAQTDGSNMLTTLLGNDEANEFTVDDDITTGFQVQANGGNDTIRTAAGDDRIFAGSGNDNVHSGDGDDRVFLADGDDFWSDLTGRNDPEFGGDDFVRGGSGADGLTSLGGSDTLFGDTGDDLLNTEDFLTQHNGNGAQADQVSGGFGDDTIRADDGDTVTGGEGQDRISVSLSPGFGQDPNAAQDWAPVVITDFNPDEDVLEADLPSEAIDAGHTLGFTGRDGEEITLTYGPFKIATLTGVSFSDLTSENFTLR